MADLISQTNKQNKTKKKHMYIDSTKIGSRGTKLQNLSIVAGRVCW